MKRIAVLGPEGTYSDIACKEYLKSIDEKYEIVYYPSILKVAKAIDDNTIAILPFENTLDGFVVESMDYIILNDYYVTSQLKLNIDFAFVTNAKSIENVKGCYVQFKAYGQCLDFISKYNFEIITTQSNIESLYKLKESDDTFGAIIPMHALDEGFNTVLTHIADSKHNETRFFIVQNKKEEAYNQNDLESSICIETHVDRPGILFDILKKFHELDLNLNSIMSRPMKTEMGKYRFYIEISLNNDNLYKLDDLVNKFSSHSEFVIKVLGIYNRCRWFLWELLTLLWKKETARSLMNLKLIF